MAHVETFPVHDTGTPRPRHNDAQSAQQQDHNPLRSQSRSHSLQSVSSQHLVSAGCLAISVDCRQTTTRTTSTSKKLRPPSRQYLDIVDRTRQSIGQGRQLPSAHGSRTSRVQPASPHHARRPRSVGSCIVGSLLSRMCRLNRVPLLHYCSTLRAADV